MPAPTLASQLWASTKTVLVVAIAVVGTVASVLSFFADDLPDVPMPVFFLALTVTSVAASVLWHAFMAANSQRAGVVANTLTAAQHEEGVKVLMFVGRRKRRGRNAN